MTMLQQFKLTGKKAIITGAARGIGRALAEALHDAGAEVTLLDILEQGEQTAKEIGSAGAKAHFVQCNLLNYQDLVQAFDTALRKMDGRVDILVNAAGIVLRSSAEEFAQTDWEKVVALNLSAVFYCSQLAGRVMLKQGSGKIINIASVTSFIGSDRNVAYSSTKGAVAQMTKSLSNEWAPRGLNINAIAPGYIATDINKDTSPERRAAITARIPKGRWGTPADLKGLAVFLAAPASDYMTGSVIPIDGGFLAR
jgi:2-deoxy-D-gluconate 3-dehydrogenase